MAFTPTDNQEVVEILVKSRMDIKQFEANMASIDRKIKESERVLQASISKIATISNKSSMAMTKTAEAQVAAQKQIKQASEQNIAAYKEMNAQMAKQIALTKELSASAANTKAKSYTWSATPGTQQAMPKVDTSNAKDTSTWFQRLVGLHNELDTSMKKTDRTSRNTFPHKVNTTAQYMLAGAGIAGVTSALLGMAAAFLEADKAQNKFVGVLGMQKQDAKDLEKQLTNVSVAYGGQLKDLNEVALALGRAGIAENKLASATQVVSQVALASGESFATVTDLLVSWSTVYPEKTFERLADEITTAGNASKASVADFNTMSNYLLTSAKQAGVTSEMALSLGASLTQVGLGASTTGTELRRFFGQLSTGSKEVKGVFNALGVDITKFKAELAKGGKASDDAMLSFMKKMADTANTGAPKAIDAISAVLDQATLKALKAAAVIGEDGKSTLDRIFEEVTLHANGSSKKAAEAVAGSFSVVAERVRNAIGSGAINAGNSLASMMFPDGDPKELTAQIDALAASTETFIKVVTSTALVAVAWKSVTSLYSAYIALAGIIPKVTFVLTGYTTAATVAGEASAVAASSVWLLRMRLLSLLATTTAVAAFAVAIWEVSDAVASFIDVDGKRTEGGSKTLNDRIKSDKIKEAAKDARALTEEYNKQKTAYENLSKAASLSTGVTAKNLKAQALQAKANMLDIKKAMEYKPAAIVKKSTKIEDNISGKTEIPLTDAENNKADNAARKLAEDALSAKREEIRLAEQLHFINAKITDEAAQKYFHINETLRLEKIAIDNASVGKRGAFRNQDDKRAESLKTEKEIKKGQNDLYAIIAKNTVEYEKQMLALSWQEKAIGSISDEKRIELGYSEKESEIKRNLNHLLSQYNDMGEDGATLAVNIYNISQKQLAVLTAQRAEQDRLLIQRREIEALQTNGLDLDAKAYKALLTGDIAGVKELDRLKLENEYAEKLRKLEQDRDNAKFANQGAYDTAVRAAKAEYEYKMLTLEGQESYVALLNQSVVTYAKSQSMAQSFMRTTDAGISALETGLTSFFTVGNDGFHKWADLRDKVAKAVLDSLMQELLINQMILVVKQAMAAVSSSGGWMSMVGSLLGGLAGGGGDTGVAMDSASSWDSGMAMAKGGVVVNGTPTYLAKGGYVNSIVKKPTYVAKGTIAGEAGAEAVMPLKRTASGELGIISQGSGGGTQQVTVSIVNESGDELKVTKSEARQDMSGMVIDIVIDAISRNKRGMRDIVKGT